MKIYIVTDVLTDTIIYFGKDEEVAKKIYFSRYDTSLAETNINDDTKFDY